MSHSERTLSLPDYKTQSPEVKQRMLKLRERPVRLEVRGLSKRYAGASRLALSDINFKTHRREFLSIIGPSGCGKSTLARLLAGLEKATSGEVLVDGQPVCGPGADRGMVFQSYTLFPWLTVRQNVEFGLKISGKSNTEALSEARTWTDLVGLSAFENAYPSQLSGGMKQRVAIARALANQPRVLLMDEPFGALDAQTRCQMQTYLLQIWKNIDVTIVFITHDLDEAIYLSDRILVLKANPGEVQELIEVPVPRPRSEAQLLSPEFLATKQRLEDLIHPPRPSGELDERLRLVKMTPAGDEVE